MERDDNSKKRHQADDAYSKNTDPKDQQEKNQNHPKENIPEDYRSLDKTERDEARENPTEPDRNNERDRKKGNRSEGMDEDMDAQKGGSYGHKSQDNAEKDGRGKQ